MARSINACQYASQEGLPGLAWAWSFARNFTKRTFPIAFVSMYATVFFESTYSRQTIYSLEMFTIIRFLTLVCFDLLLITFFLGSCKHPWLSNKVNDWFLMCVKKAEILITIVPLWLHMIIQYSWLLESFPIWSILSPSSVAIALYIIAVVTIVANTKVLRSKKVSEYPLSTTSASFR